MPRKVNNAHLTLNVKNCENVFVSGFTGYLVFGEIELLNFTKKSLCVPICNYVKFFTDLNKVVKFFDFECTTDNQDSCFLCLPKPELYWKWRGKITPTTTGFDKAILLSNNDIVVFTLNDDQFLVFVESMLKVVLYTFIFKETEIIFVQTLIENKLLFSNDEFANEKNVEKFIRIFSTSNDYNKFLLKQLYYSYKNEFKFLFQFKLLFLESEKPHN